MKDVADIDDERAKSHKSHDADRGKDGDGTALVAPQPAKEPSEKMRHSIISVVLEDSLQFGAKSIPRTTRLHG